MTTLLDWLDLGSADEFDPAVCGLIEINDVIDMTRLLDAMITSSAERTSEIRS